MNFIRFNRMFINKFLLFAVLSALFFLLYGCDKSGRRSLIVDIQTHILVPGESHSGLWLGPVMFFKPGWSPQDFHIFLTETDRKGSDSVQKRRYFIVDSLPVKVEDFSGWWKKWQEQFYPTELSSRNDDADYEWVPCFTWKYHKQTGKWLGIGHLLRHKDKQLSDHVEHLAITYSVFDTDTEKFSAWKSFRININGEEKPSVAYGQRVDLANGDILLPFSIVNEFTGRNSLRWCGAAYCTFDGVELKPIKESELFTNTIPRGFVEPSMAFYDGRYYMTLRAQDGFGYVVISKDAMNISEPQPWCWDDGKPIDMNQTMTKFLTHSDGLYLVYTRITPDNENVFRNRAPLFIARIDAEKACLLRDSEQIIFPNRGLPIGNPRVYDVSPNESWVTVAEWDQTGHDIKCDILLGRILWRKKNKNIQD